MLSPLLKPAICKEPPRITLSLSTVVAANTDKRDIALTLSSQQTNWLVTDIETNRAWVVKGGEAFIDRLQPGDGKIYRLEAATVSGTKTFPQLKFVGGGVLTLVSNANITAHGNMDTVNIVLGANAIFKADTGSSMVIPRDSAFVFGSGSLLELGGLLRTTYGNYTTVPYGSTLRIRPGAVLQWGTYGSVVIEGTLSAIGTANWGYVSEGVVAARVGLDAAERARPFAAAVDQLALTYGRVGHRLEALRLRLSAEADAGVVAGAAMALTSGETQPAAAQDVVAVAVEISQAEQSAVTALATLGAAPSRIADVVLNASASLARDTGDDEGLADVLRSVRRELER